MSYYILPKTNNIISIRAIISENKQQIYTSYSLFNYYIELYSQLQKICDDDDETIHSALKLINPCEYIFSKVPGSKFSVSKLKPQSNIFYDFLEISNNSNIFENHKSSDMKTLHVSPNWKDIVYCYELLREDRLDEVISFSDTDTDTDTDTNTNTCNTFYEKINTKKFDFIFFEIDQTIFEDVNIYTLKLIEVLKIILKCQNSNGTIVIKIDNIFYKSVIDIIYILTSLYEKTIIVKPNTSNISNFEKYIVCKNFIINDSKCGIYQKYYYDLNQIVNKNLIGLNIQSIIDQEIPYHFINKIDDINIINGQQQLESIIQVINILKNKNKEDKIEYIKKTNIQKSVNWCEKFKIPCNKFSDRVNIFLPITKETTEVNENTLTT